MIQLQILSKNNPALSLKECEILNVEQSMDMIQGEGRQDERI